MSVNEHRYLEPLKLRHEWEVDRYADESMRELREPMEKVVAAFHGTDEKLAEKARRFLAGMGEYVIVPVLDSRSKPKDPDDVAWELRLGADLERSLRRKVAAKCESLLDDKRLIPALPPGVGRSERQEPARRVCDEAYAVMLDLVHFGESRVDAYSDTKVFFRLSDAEKDKIIAKARSENAWKRGVWGEQGV